MRERERQSESEEGKREICKGKARNRGNMKRKKRGIYERERGSESKEDEGKRKSEVKGRER